MSVSRGLAALALASVAVPAQAGIIPQTPEHEIDRILPVEVVQSCMTALAAQTRAHPSQAYSEVMQGGVTCTSSAGLLTVSDYEETVMLTLTQADGGGEIGFMYGGDVEGRRAVDAKFAFEGAIGGDVALTGGGFDRYYGTTPRAAFNRLHSMWFDQIQAVQAGAAKIFYTNDPEAHRPPQLARRGR